MNYTLSNDYRKFKILSLLYFKIELKVQFCNNFTNFVFIGNTYKCTCIVTIKP